MKMYVDAVWGEGDFDLVADCPLCGKRVRHRLITEGWTPRFTEGDVELLRRLLTDHENACYLKQEVTITLTRAERDLAVDYLHRATRGVREFPEIQSMLAKITPWRAPDEPDR